MSMADETALTTYKGGHAMSLSDDLKQAEKRLKSIQEQEKAKKPARKKTRASAADWTWENEIVALFLYRSSASKFIKENYSKKRKVSTRAMTMRMAMFESIDKGRPQKNVTEQSKEVFKQHSQIEIKELQTIVVSILRGEYERAADA